MKRTLFIFITFVFLSAAACAETILLKGGEEIEGKILSQEDGEVVVERHGMTVTYYEENIDHIRVDDPAVEEVRVEEVAPVAVTATAPVPQETGFPVSLRAPADLKEGDLIEFYYRRAEDLLDKYPGRHDVIREQVIPYGEEMARLEPENPYGYYILSRARRYLGYMIADKYDEIGVRTYALPLAEKAVLLAPENSLMLMNLAMCYDNMGRYNEALEQIEKAITLSETEELMAHHIVHKGIILKAKGDYQKAKECFEQAETMPMEQKTKEYLADHFGNLYSKLKQYNQALVYKKKHVELNPESPWALHNLGSTYRRAEKFDEAIYYELKALELSDFGAARAGLSNAYRRKAKEMIKEDRDLAEAEGYLFKALEYDPDNEKAYEWLARYYEKIGDVGNTRKYVGETLKRDPDNTWALKQKENNR